MRLGADRVFGLVVILGALAYIAGAFQIQTSFMSDPVGSKTFPILLGLVAALCGAVMVWKPDPEPDWPAPLTFGALALAVAVLVAYAYSLKPFGFLVPTAIAAGILSYQISPRALPAAATGVGLSLVLYSIFKFIFGLNLVAWPKFAGG